MATIYVDPIVPQWWGRSCVVHANQQVAWINVYIVGVSHWGRRSDCRADVVQKFIDNMGWRGKALNNLHGNVTRNVVRQSNWSHTALRPGANGLLEYSGNDVVIIWEWDQVLDWLMHGWPNTRFTEDVSTPVGTWCYAEGVDPLADHIVRGKYVGWPYAMKQMRTIGIPGEVRRLERPLTETEAVDGLCGALKKHRVKLNKIHS